MGFFSVLCPLFKTDQEEGKKTATKNAVLQRRATTMAAIFVLADCVCDKSRHFGCRLGVTVHEGGIGAVGKSIGDCYQFAFTT